MKTKPLSERKIWIEAGNIKGWFIPNEGYKEAVDDALFDIANNCSEKRNIIPLGKVINIFKMRFGEFK